MVVRPAATAQEQVRPAAQPEGVMVAHVADHVIVHDDERQSDRPRTGVEKPSRCSNHIA